MKQIKDYIFYGVVILFAVATLACLILIISYIMGNGLKEINWEFLSESPRLMGKEGGIFPVIIGTIYVTAVAVIIAAPIGIASAIYFVEYAKPGKLISLIRMFTEILAGIPSIIFGLFGFAFFVVFLNMGWSVLSGGLSLSLMILPTLIRTTEESLKTVPLSYREGSLSLGASKWQTISKVVLPCCKKGLLSGLILAVGRAIGETAVVMLTAGSALNIPLSIFDSTRTMSVHMYTLTAEGLSQERAFATGALLIIIVLIINAGANLISSKLGGNDAK